MCAITCNTLCACWFLFCFVGIEVAAAVDEKNCVSQVEAPLQVATRYITHLADYAFDCRVLYCVCLLYYLTHIALAVSSFFVAAVATQRNHFMSKQALKCITHRTTKLADMKAHHSTAIQAFLRKYWSVLVTHVQFHRRSVRRSRVGKDTFSMRCVSNALLYWVQYTGQHCKLNTALTNACANIRAKRLTSAVAVWKQHAQCEVKKIVNMKTSYLFYKRQMFHSFLDGVRRYLQQSLVITTRYRVFV